jgi:hypothetical protein
MYDGGVHKLDLATGDGTPAAGRGRGGPSRPEPVLRIRRGHRYGVPEPGRRPELLADGNGKLETVLERSGQCWLTAGAAGLFRSVDHGLSYQRLTTIEEALTVGFGKAAPGRNEMAVYTSGTVNGVPGIHRSDDSGLSWRRVNDDRHQYASTNDAIAGDPRVYGRVYLSTNGLGIPYGEPI